jgi:hypothetical protein
VIEEGRTFRSSCLDGSWVDWVREGWKDLEFHFGRIDYCGGRIRRLLRMRQYFLFLRLLVLVLFRGMSEG